MNEERRHRFFGENGSRYRVFSLNRFKSAPISKAWALATACGSCGLIAAGRFRWTFVLSLEHILNRDELWRCFLSKLLFLDIGSIVAGCLLIYAFRDVERRMGSARYLSYIITSTVVGLLLEVPFFYWLHNAGWPALYFASGPYLALSSLFATYLFDIPFLPYAQVFIPFSKKNLPCLFALQLLLVSQSSRCACVSGFVAGLLLRWTPLAHLNYFPSFITNTLAESSLVKWFSSWLEDRQGVVLPLAATIERQRQEWLDRHERQLMHSYRAAANNGTDATGSQRIENMIPLLQRMMRGEDAGVPVATEEQVRRLQDMGFADREEILSAMRVNNNDLSSAAQYLAQRHR